MKRDKQANPFGDNANANNKDLDILTRSVELGSDKVKDPRETDNYDMGDSITKIVVKTPNSHDQGGNLVAVGMTRRASRDMT